MKNAYTGEEMVHESDYIDNIRKVYTAIDKAEGKDSIKFLSFVNLIYQTTNKNMTLRVLEQTCEDISNNSTIIPQRLNKGLFLDVFRKFGYPVIKRDKQADDGYCKLNLCDGSGFLAVEKNGYVYLNKCRCAIGKAKSYDMGKSAPCGARYILPEYAGTDRKEQGIKRDEQKHADLMRQANTSIGLFSQSL